VLRVTALMHLPLVLAFAEPFRAAGVRWPLLAGLGIAALGLVAFRSRFQAALWDRPRSLVRRIADELYFVHWCAAFGAAVPITVGGLAAVAIGALRGQPFSAPTGLAFMIYAPFLAVAAYGVLLRRRMVAFRDIEVEVRDLPSAFEGYRIAQLSDLHIGGLTPREMAEKWVAIANRAAPDLVAVTGDLVTSGVAFHDDIAAVIGQLRGKDGVFVALGNHDYFGEGEPLVDKLRAAGAIVLRNETTTLKRGEATLRLAAVDDTWTGRADLERTLAGSVPGEPTVLMAHDPDLFPRAARLGADVVLSGHTHGGQIALPFFVQQVNLSQLVHRHTYGIYRIGDATLYVHAGLGTTGPPIRIGAPPEVVIVTLRRAA
jgi:uncharacterized protein